MARREKLQDRSGLYFVKQSETLEFISSGAEILNRVMGGGYPLGRTVNIVGDKAVGKSLLAIEACANALRQDADFGIRYAEAEAAFDKPYAAALGLDVDKISFARDTDDLNTVEDFYEDISRHIDKVGKRGGLYVLDSLDALSDRAEMKNKIDAPTYGAGKAKMMSQTFRRITRSLEDSRVGLIIVSQIRDKIGVTFGKKYTRTGGHALDFYASIVLYLAQIEKITRTVNKVKRPTGICIRVKCDKNKVALPYRECELDITFGYGIDDMVSNANWLVDNGLWTKDEAKRALDTDDVAEQAAVIESAVRQGWVEIERQFVPSKRKYT